jgi:hypothetical protein
MFPQTTPPPCSSSPTPQTAPGATALKEPPDTAPAQQSTHTGPLTGGRHSAAQPPTSPPVHSPDTCAPPRPGPDQQKQTMHDTMHSPPAPTPLARLPPLTHAARAHPACRHGPSTHDAVGAHDRSRKQQISAHGSRARSTPATSPKWRVPIPNRYTAKAKLCFCKNNKRTIIITASEHGMGSGGSAADATAIGCPGAERRGEPFLVLSHFRSRSDWGSQ